MRTSGYLPAPKCVQSYKWKSDVPHTFDGVNLLKIYKTKLIIIMNSQIFLFNFKFIINIIIFDDLATLIANKKIIVFNHLLYFQFL